MRRLIVSTSICSFVGCVGPEPPGNLEVRASTMATTGAEEPAAPRALVPRASPMAIAREGFADADIGVPPPPAGSTVPLLRLSRPDRSADELGRRLAVVLTAMGIALERSDVLAWAEAASSGVADPSISEPLPGLILTYDHELDDLMVIDTSRLDAPTRTSTERVPWNEARLVARTLADQGILDPDITLDAADVAFVRSGVKGPDATHERWVDEIVFEANQRVEGMEVIDAGVRIGVTPVGDIFSVRVTGIEVEYVGAVTIGTTLQALEAAFAEHVVGLALPVSAVHVEMRRPVYMLDPSARSALIEPRYMITHALVTGDGETSTVSRSAITLWGMSSPAPRLEARLPATRAEPLEERPR